MSNTFSNKSFMNRYFSGGPAKTVKELEQKEDEAAGPAKSSGPANKVKKVARKTLKSQKLNKEAQEIEGQHGYGSNNKSKRKRKRADRKREKVKKIYTSLSSEDKNAAEQEYKKRLAK